LIHKIIRYIDAGYDEAIEFAEKNDVKIPMMKLMENNKNDK
jgi:urocanate hydratase